MRPRGRALHARDGSTGSVRVDRGRPALGLAQHEDEDEPDEGDYREAKASFASAAHVDGTREQARAVLTRAQRAVERRPSAWITAHLHRAEATLLVGDGRLEEARTLLERRPRR